MPSHLQPTNGSKGGKFTLVLDSSQISSYLECPQRWVYSYVRKLQPLGFVEDAEAMNAGTYGHKLLDIFYRAKAKGVGLNDAIERCFAYNPDSDTCNCGCTIDYHHTIELLGVQECSRCHKCLKFVPRPFALAEPIRGLVRNRFREYCFKYQLNDFQPISESHVEVGFSEPIYEDHYNLFVLEGRIDLLARLQGLACIVDHKFQMKTHWLYPKTVQFKNYALVTKANMFVINYVRLQKTLSPDSMARDLITFTTPELLAWKQRLIRIFLNIKDTLLSEQPEQRWNACKGDFPTYDKQRPRYCWYTQLCEEVDERMRAAREAKLYQVKKEEWKPW